MDALTVEGVARAVGLSVRALHAGFCREFSEVYRRSPGRRCATADQTCLSPNEVRALQENPG